jgi:FkbM family methyltransferase
MRKANLRPTAFVLVSTNHGSLLVNRHDYRIVQGGAYGVGHQLLESSAFDPDEVDVAVKLLEMRRAHFGDGVVALDCGANIGVHTVEWAQAMHGWGQVVAVEAQERVFYALAGNITLNNCFNARAIWAAVGQEAGTINVPAPDYFTPSSFGSLEIRQTERTEFIGQAIDYSAEKASPTRMVPIDDLGFQRLDFVKIDIEDLGIAIDSLRSPRGVARQCLDWTERRHHLAGPLGVKLLEAMTAHGWLALEAQGRAVRVTAEGAKALRERLDVTLEETAQAAA